MDPEPDRPGTQRSWSLMAVRYGLPLALVIAGIVLIIIGHASTRSVTATTGLVLAGIALIVWMLNWMFRMSVDSNRDREKEEAAREYFTEHGHWPDEGRG